MPQDARISKLVLEKHPDAAGRPAEVKVLSPMSDASASHAGHILVGWGQMADTLHRYTKCVIEFNNSDPIPTKIIEFRRLLSLFTKETNKAFKSAPTASEITRNFVRAVTKAKSVRESLSHDRIYWGTHKGKDCITVNYKTKNGQERVMHLNHARLESTRRDIEKAHGLLFHLSLQTRHPPSYTPTEISLLREIVAKGYLNLPNINKHQDRC